MDFRVPSGFSPQHGPGTETARQGAAQHGPGQQGLRGGEVVQVKNDAASILAKGARS